MTGLWIKLVVCPAVVLFADYIMQEIYYPALYQAVLVGLVLAVAGHMMEVMFLKRGTLWINTIMDFFASAAIVFISPFFFRGAAVSLIGALLTASLLAITEYLQHRRLIGTGRTQKTPH